MKRESSPEHTPLLTTDVQRFRWAIWFAQLNLATLWTQNWLSLQTELRDFLNSTHKDLEPGGLFVNPSEPPVPEEFSRENFRALQADTQAVLQAVIQSRTDPTGINLTPMQLQFATVPARPRETTGPERQVLVAEGTTRDVFLLRLWVLLGHVNTTGLLRCRECGAIFYRQRNQEYCGRTCVNRVSQRRWRERHLIAAGQVTETDTAQAVTPGHTGPVGQASAPSVAPAQPPAATFS
jgi:hypothetical protein